MNDDNVYVYWLYKFKGSRSGPIERVKTMGPARMTYHSADEMNRLLRESGSEYVWLMSNGQNLYQK